MLALILATAISLSDLNSIPCAAPKTEFDRVNVIGVARPSIGGDIVYCEYHHHLKQGEVQVDYISPSGVTFAVKHLHYGDNLTTPEFLQTDQRKGEIQEVKLENNSWALHYRENSKDKTKQTLIPKADVDVIDAGFDHAVRKYWSQIQANEKVVINFASTVFQRSLSLRISKRPMDQCPKIEGNNSCIWVEAGNAVIRIFVDPLQLVYNDKQQLVLFRGVVNIQNDAGKKQSADISYFYRQ